MSQFFFNRYINDSCLKNHSLSVRLKYNIPFKTNSIHVFFNLIGYRLLFATTYKIYTTLNYLQFL